MKAPAHLHRGGSHPRSVRRGQAIIGDILEAYEARPSAARVACDRRSCRTRRDTHVTTSRRSFSAPPSPLASLRSSPPGCQQARASIWRAQRAIEDLSADGLSARPPTAGATATDRVLSVAERLEHAARVGAGECHLPSCWRSRRLVGRGERHRLPAVASGITTGPIVAQAPIGYTGTKTRRRCSRIHSCRPRRCPSTRATRCGNTGPISATTRCRARSCSSIVCRRSTARCLHHSNNSPGALSLHRRHVCWALIRCW